MEPTKRTLIYIPAVHHYPQPLYGKEAKEVREVIDALNEYLPNYYHRLAKRLVEQFPAHKVYAEGYNEKMDEETYLNSGLSLDILVKAFVEHGAKLMPTEHFGIGIMQQLMIEKAGEEKGAESYVALAEEMKKNPPKKVLSIFKKVFETTFCYDILCKLCEGEDTFDMEKLRDKYIASNIDSTLGQNEMGVLIIGGKHKVHERLAKTDIKIINLNYLLYLMKKEIGL